MLRLAAVRVVGALTLVLPGAFAQGTAPPPETPPQPPGLTILLDVSAPLVHDGVSLLFEGVATPDATGKVRYEDAIDAIHAKAVAALRLADTEQSRAALTGVLRIASEDKRPDGTLVVRATISLRDALGLTSTSAPPAPADATGIPLANRLPAMPVGPSENPRDETTEGLLLQIRNAPKDAEPYNRLGLRYAAGGRIQEALLAFQRAAELWGTDPKAASPRCNLGAILFSQHRFGDALKQYKLALQADPSSALAHYGAGSSYETLGESGLARGEYGACLAGEAKGPIADAARAAMERLAAAAGGARTTGPAGGATPPAGGGR